MLFHFSMKFSKQTEQPQMGRRVLLAYVCLCPIKGSTGINELIKQSVPNLCCLCLEKTGSAMVNVCFA